MKTPGIDYIQQLYDECKAAERFAEEHNTSTITVERPQLILLDRVQPTGHVFFAEQATRLNDVVYDVGYDTFERPHRSVLHYTTPANHFEFSNQPSLIDQLRNHAHKPLHTLYARNEELSPYIQPGSVFGRVFMNPKVSQNLRS